MQQRVLQHAPMAGRKDKPVPIEPARIFGIEFQKPIPKNERRRRSPHRYPGMPRIRFLNGVDAQETNGVDTTVVERRVRHGFFFQFGRWLKVKKHNIGLQLFTLKLFAAYLFAAYSNPALNTILVFLLLPVCSVFVHFCKKAAGKSPWAFFKSGKTHRLALQCDCDRFSTEFLKRYDLYLNKID
jgi:hypothetical protein